MNDVLDKTIAGDWYDMRLTLDNRHRFAANAKLTNGEQASLMQILRLAVERGTVEVKRKALIDVFAFVDALQFDTRSFQDFTHHIREVVKITFLILLQRAYCAGKIAPKPDVAGPGVADEVAGQASIGAIVEDVQQRMAKDPVLRSNASVKHILMQVSIYRRELANMKELAPNIPKEKLAAFRANFKRSFADITRKIQDHYSTLLQEEVTLSRTQRWGGRLHGLDLKPLLPLFTAQAQEFTRIRSILSYAERERYKTREILSGIGRKRDTSLAVVEREIKEYERIAFGRGAEIARQFASEIADYLGRRTSTPIPEEEE